jgi:hypothetical protein
MSFTVYYNIPDSDDKQSIETYNNITNIKLFIPKFLLLKMADYSYLKTKEKLEPLNSMTELNCLIQGFTHIGFMNPMMEIKDIREYINQYLLNCSENDMVNLYNKLFVPNEEGYSPFGIMEIID